MSFCFSSVLFNNQWKVFITVANPSLYLLTSFLFHWLFCWLIFGNELQLEGLLAITLILLSLVGSFQNVKITSSQWKFFVKLTVHFKPKPGLWIVWALTVNISETFICANFPKVFIPLEFFHNLSHYNHKPCG